MTKIESNTASELQRLRNMTEQEIDTTDIPPTLDWSNPTVGKFYIQAEEHQDSAAKVSDNEECNPLNDESNLSEVSG